MTFGTIPMIPTTLIVRPTDNDKWMLALPSGKKVCTFHDEFTAYSVRRSIYETWKKEER
jgi:hypothetical protein